MLLSNGHKQNTNRCEEQVNIKEAVTIATITMESPLNTHRCTSIYSKIPSIQLTEIQKKKKKTKSQENLKAVSRKELKVEKLELSQQVSLLCPCPGLARGRIMKGNIFHGFLLPTGQSAVLSLLFEGFCSLRFLDCHLSS